MKSAVLDVVPDLPILVAVSVYDNNSYHFILVCCNTIKWVHKKREVYDNKTEIVHDNQFLYLNLKDL